MDDKRLKMAQNIILENRKNLTVSGVKDVDSFDERTVTMFTELGMLMVKGGGLHINKFNMETGELVLEGEIDSLNYSEQEKRVAGNFIAKLFK